VRTEDSPATELIEAVGTLSNDGKLFSVVSIESMARSRATTCATEIS